MGDAKDSKKIQSDRAAKKLKDKEHAKRLRPDTTSGKGSVGESVPMVTKPQDGARHKSGSK
jgi:hypothetical protein